MCINDFYVTYQVSNALCLKNLPGFLMNKNKLQLLFNLSLIPLMRIADQPFACGGWLKMLRFEVDDLKGGVDEESKLSL